MNVTVITMKRELFYLCQGMCEKDFDFVKLKYYYYPWDFCILNGFQSGNGFMAFWNSIFFANTWYCILKKKIKIRQIQVYMKGTAGLRMTLVFFSVTSTVYLEAQLFWIQFFISDNYLKAVLFLTLALAKLFFLTILLYKNML